MRFILMVSAFAIGFNIGNKEVNPPTPYGEHCEIGYIVDITK